MYLKNLVNATSSLEEMPIEIEELAGALIGFGCQDEIIFRPDDLMDPSVLRGVHYRYTTHGMAYAEPKFTTLIVYSSLMPLEWQRIVCCKELIHTCDDVAERTNTEEEVEGLLEKILGPLTTESFGVADLMAAKDKFAIYQALVIMFPPQAVAQALALLNAGKTLEQIARWVMLPVSLVEMALDPDWPVLREKLIDL